MLATNKDFDGEEKNLIAYKSRDKVEKQICNAEKHCEDKTSVSGEG